MNSNLDDQYARIVEPLKPLAPVIAALVRDVLAAEGLRVHSVEHRIKSPTSVHRKLHSRRERYAGIGELDDLVGVRVITYFPDEVDRVGGLMEAEFEIDRENSLDKRALLDPDRFGYLSLHYVCQLTPARLALREYARLRGCRFELQVRSLLQHAWAEIEHDLGYHASTAVPVTIRRRFSRLAGLLEVADDEFQRLRDDVVRHQATVAAALDEGRSVALDRDSVAHFIRTSALVSELDNALVASWEGASLEEVGPIFAESYVRELVWIGITDIKQLVEQLEQHQEAILAFAKVWLNRPGENDDDRELPQGISLFYLAYVLLAMAGDADRISEYGRACGISNLTGEEVLATYREACI